MSNIKVHELAKELSMSSKDMLDKIHTMGIDAKSHMSVLTEIDVIAIKNTVQRGRNGAETKIVKAAPKKTSPQQENKEVKVVVKAAAKPNMTAEAAEKAQKAKTVQVNREQKQESPTQGSGQRAKEQGDVSRPSPQAEKQQNRPQQRSHDPGRQQNDQGQRQQKPSEQRDQGTRQQKPMTQKDQGQRPQRTTDGNQQKTRSGDRSQTMQDKTENRAGQRQPNRTDSSNRSNTSQQQDQKNQRSQQGQGQRSPQGQGQRPQQGQGQRPQQGQGQRPQQGQGQRTQQGQGQNQNQRPNQNAKPGKSSHFGQQRKPAHKPKPAPKPVEPEINLEELEPGTKIINVPITVAGFADQIEKSTSMIIMALMKLGIMANINQNLDEDTVVLLGEELGVPILVGKVAKEVVEEGLELFEDKEEDLKPRSPIITVMGHVDHGKTSLLDAIRKTSVTTMESGGITQHIGASEVYANGQKIVFLDTPGHEAFTAMRARGAHVTDIAVLVVAADDSVKPQTVEAISHAKAANVPIIVAINKMDKPDIDPTRVKQDLTEHGILIEEWGGDTICVPVSAKTGEGIDTLLEMILLQSEVLELKANPNRLAMGTVIEARLDKTRGAVATLLVLNGTLQAGMSVVAGTCAGRIKAMTNFKGDAIRKAGPATAVEILGLTEVPEAGDEFNAVKEDRLAREIAENRRVKLREEVMARNSSTTLEQLFSQIQEGEIKELNLIIKGDVQGSVGALTQSLEKLQNENVKVKIIHTGVGTVTESDIMLASTSGAIVIAFNVRPSTAVSSMADREKIEIRTYRVIYDAIDDVEAAMKGMLDPVFKEVVMGKIEIRDTFKVPGIGIIGGAYVLEGKVLRNLEVRLVRDGIVIHEGKISSLKRFKDDVKEVNHGYECGIGIENYNDLKVGDIIEAFQMEEIERK